jgi:hypothetical protein
MDMKRLLLVAALVLGGCSTSASKAPMAPAAVAAVAAPELVGPDGVAIERVPFHAGVSSATVEKLAKQQACSGGLGAGLVTEPGPVEVYRMRCDNGKVFMARCELRQCKKM